MISTKNKKGFTLIELIVVITILAILGTIAFIALNGYAGESRDSKRMSDLKSIQQKMTIENAANDASLLAFVKDNSSVLTTINLAGATATPAKYNAGNINFALLDAKEKDFQDPITKASYKIGATTQLGEKFELAAKLEGDDETNDHAYIVGDYMPRTDSPIDITAALTNTTTVFEIKNAVDYGKIKKGDTLDTGVVDKVSSDGKTITLKNNATTTLTTVKLKVAETKGLIKSTVNATTPVENGSDTALPY